MPVITEQAATLRAQALLARLTPRERQIFDLVGIGLRCAEISQRLGIAPGTVDAHKSRILLKLGIDSSTELRKFACGITTQRLRTALAAATRDLETVADLAGHTTPAGAHALSSIKRIASAAEHAA